MNLWLRLILTLLRTRRLPPLGPDGTVERSMRVMPNDLDVNRHMNNGRYLTIIDLLVIEYFVRTGLFRQLLARRWSPVLGGSVISYRRELRPFQRYTVRLKVECADERWNYMRFDFLDEGGRVAASGYAKGAARARGGLVANAEVHAAIGRPFEGGPLTEPVRHWVETERAMMAA